MSNVYLASLRFVKTDPTAKAVLMAMADICDDEGNLYPSLEYLCDCTCLHKVTVIRAIERLEAEGYVAADRSNGRKTTYKLNQKPVAQSDRLQSATGIAAQPNRLHRVTKPVAQSNSNHKEPSITITKAKKPKPVFDAELFERFWLAYPNKKGKKAARDVFEKLGLTAGDPRLPAIREGLARQKKSREWLKDGGEFIPHASTWLNGERWNDECTPANVIPLGGMEAPLVAQKVAL